MKNTRFLYVLIMAAFVMISCGQSASKNETENKTAPAQDQQDSPAATSVVTPESVAPEESAAPLPTTEEKRTSATGAPKTVPTTSKGSQAPSQTRGLGMDSDPDNTEILAQIDKYLLSSVQLSANPAGGFSHGIVTLTNTLSHASFQKVLLEVSILNEDGSLLRSDYYTVINIDADGGTKIVKLPESKTGKKISTHIMKVKSNELTKGEFVLTGTH